MTVCRGWSYFPWMPVDFLSDDETARYGQYCGPPSQVELERMFFLDDADRRLIRACRGSRGRMRTK
ncbi:DUF4158 domain-containing protein [Streptosporangium sp. NBC_01495]|uniref:DUF4158 domain-containing protein n=2 Tax=unclassified Streptosporangium TaxID=2632669 RepID=UPI003FCEC51C